MNELKLEAGKKYVTRSRWITPPLKADPMAHPDDFPFYVGDPVLSGSTQGGDSACWRSSGRLTSRESPLDLIAEYHEPASAGWILCSDRMPTEEDGCQGCTRDDEEGCVLWMTLEMGLYARKWNDPPVAVAVVAWLPIPKFTPPAPEPKLPDPPPGRQWHKPEALTPEMLREGWRPLLVWEVRQTGDEFQESEIWRPTGSAGIEVMGTHTVAFRTKRPLPAPEPVRIPLGPADIPPGSFLRGEQGVDGDGWCSIIACDRNGIATVNMASLHESTEIEMWTYQECMEGKAEISRDNGQTWEPCWKEGGAQ